jgi:hypothetical protein
MIKGGAASKISRFNERSSQPAACSFIGTRQAVNAPADDEHIVEVSLDPG